MAPTPTPGLFTVVTFAPVQGFISSSRKLRDLYGSSLLLSHLAKAIACDASSKEGITVISPGSVDSSRGVPNVLVLKGDYLKAQASKALLECWGTVLKVCREWLEQTLEAVDNAPPDWERSWGPSWKACAQHSWELFHGQGITIKEARQALAVNKLQRAWNVPNWTGESSTLSSAGAVARQNMGLIKHPRDVDPNEAKEEARAFLASLREHPMIGEAFAGEKEELSITELVKRLVTYQPMARKLGLEIPGRFEYLSNRAEDGADKSESIIWFMADGDRIGEHLESLAEREGEAIALQKFSTEMRTWAASLYEKVPRHMDNKAMVVYAGGDDLFGALHETEPGRRDLTYGDLWHWLESFQELWKSCDQEGLTASMGLVWANTSVPQRDALQHARDAEASAKARGRNRFALRLLYASGNHLEWTCPWEWLKPICDHYCDREGNSGHKANWRHLADDLIWLRSRQAIASNVCTEMAPRPSQYRQRDNDRARPSIEASIRTAHTLWDCYFPGCVLVPEEVRPVRKSKNQPASSSKAGQIEPAPYRATREQPEDGRRFDEWLLDLGRVMAGLQKWNSQQDGREAVA